MAHNDKVSCIARWGCGVCLVAAVAISFLAVKDSSGTSRDRLSNLVPRNLAGWNSQDVPLGDTEIIGATARLLNYDDYVYRVYRKGGEEVFIYAMYWKQGSISVREIAGHSPDGCWITNGARFSAPKASRTFLVGGQLTSPAEVREFVFPNNQHAQVLWWHIWGENLVDRGFDRKTIVPTLRELWVWLARRGGQRRDQVLVRIHTPGDLDAAMKSEPVAAFLKNFPEVFRAKAL